MSNPLLSRKTSGFALSISTGMAMETLFAPRAPVYDPLRMPPPRASLGQYDTVWIHVRTLLRNILNSTEFGDIREIRPEELARSLAEEVDTIKSLFSNEGQNLLAPVFYDSNYQSFYRGQSAEYKLRVVTSDKQTAWFNCLEAGLQKAMLQGMQVLHTGSSLRPNRPSERALILSHITPDLLSHSYFGSMELLESHTGKIKTRREWNTKYHQLGEEKFERFPWSRQLLCYLGDKYVIAPLSVKIRKQILAVAEERKWTPMTSPNMVHLDLQKYIKDDETRAILSKISL